MGQKNALASDSPVAAGANGRVKPAAGLPGVPRMASHPPTLVVENQDMAKMVVLQVEKAVGQACRLQDFAGVRERFTREHPDLLIVVATSQSLVRLARQLVQEIKLRKLQFIVVVLVENYCDQPLGDLQRAGSHVLFWPRDAVTLGQINKAHQKRRDETSTFPKGAKESLIARRMLARTPSLRPLAEKLALAAEHDVTVLLTGETGTGKSFLARPIHEFSKRCSNRFLIAPCGAIANNLMESEFFGHVRGAFTGADRDRIGKFAAAGNGTLLLDEVDALGLEQQAKLLRVVETGEYEPVGSTQTHQSTCRILVASNRNLEHEVERGRFRRDLFYRLNILTIHLPPLRERVEDIAPLARTMAARFNTKFDKELYDISPEALAALEACPWPGNIRELENAVQQAVLVSQGPLLLVNHLPQAVQEYAASSKRAGSLVHDRQAIERNVIQRALARHNYSRVCTARELGVSRPTLYKKMKQYRLMIEPTSASP